MPTLPSTRLTRGLTLAVCATAFTFALGLNLSIDKAGPDETVSVSLGVDEAEAQNYRAQSRRVSRRTSRRVSRRHSYIRSLPAGCTYRGAYHYCGGVYYQPVVQSGSTVYVVVTP